MDFSKKISFWFQKLSEVVLVNIRSDENYELVSSFRLSYRRFLSYLVLFFFVCTAIAYLFLKTLLSAWHDPATRKEGYAQKLILLNHKLDSLEVEIKARDQYLHSITGVINGDNQYLSDKNKTELKQDSSDLIKLEDLSVSEKEQEFRKEFENTSGELKNLPTAHHNSAELINLISPVEGIVLQSFNLSKTHYGIDISTSEKSPIVASANGTVVFSEFSSDDGNTIILLHNGGYLSVYKHNSLLLKKMGDVVKTGDLIAISGNTGRHTTGPHLHFELWYKGVPLNPQHYIWF